MKTIALLTLALVGAVASPTQAAVQVFTNKTQFLSVTAATNASGPIPNIGEIGQGPYTIGAVRLSTFPGHGIQIGGASAGPSFDWTPLLPGNDIAIDDSEDIDVMLSTPVFSFGFEFVEPSLSPSGNPETDSTFTVTLMRTGSPVGSFTFNAPDDVAAFVGVSSDAAFDTVQIRETIGGIDDEFFGQFYTGGLATRCPPASIRLSEAEVCWPSQSNTVYRVDYRSDFTTNTWVALFTNVVGTGESMCVYDKIARGQPQRFYRVVCPTE